MLASRVLGKIYRELKQRRRRRQQERHYIKMNSRFFTDVVAINIPICFLKISNVGEISWELNSWRPHQSLERERKIFRRVFTSSGHEKLRAIRKFHLLVVQ